MKENFTITPARLSLNAEAFLSYQFSFSWWQAGVRIQPSWKQRDHLFIQYLTHKYYCYYLNGSSEMTHRQQVPTWSHYPFQWLATTKYTQSLNSVPCTSASWQEYEPHLLFSFPAPSSFQRNPSRNSACSILVKTACHPCSPQCLFRSLSFQTLVQRCQLR